MPFLTQCGGFFVILQSNMEEFWISLLNVVNAMSPYLLLGFLIAGVLHVYVPKRCP